jgi:hypothetical protein
MGTDDRVDMTRAFIHPSWSRGGKIIDWRLIAVLECHFQTSVDIANPTAKIYTYWYFEWLCENISHDAYMIRRMAVAPVPFGESMIRMASSLTHRLPVSLPRFPSP